MIGNTKNAPQVSALLNDARTPDLNLLISGDFGKIPNETAQNMIVLEPQTNFDELQKTSKFGNPSIGSVAESAEFAKEDKKKEDQVRPETGNIEIAFE